MPCIFLILYQLVSYVVVETFICSPYVSLKNIFFFAHGHEIYVIFKNSGLIPFLFFFYYLSLFYFLL